MILLIGEEGTMLMSAWISGSRLLPRHGSEMIPYSLNLLCFITCEERSFQKVPGRLEPGNDNLTKSGISFSKGPPFSGSMFVFRGVA